MYRRIRVIGPALGFAAAATLAGCDRLPVENKGNPDVGKAMQTPALAESFISKLFQQMHQGVYNTSSSVWPGTMVMSFESSSQLGNFGMGTRAAIPRSGIDNSRGNSYQSENLRVFDQLQRNGRQAANAIVKFDSLMGPTLGGALRDEGRDARAKSAAFFALGWALGQTAMVYDSASIITPEIVRADPFKIIPLSGAKEVNDAALQMLDSALLYAAKSTSFPKGNDWYAQAADITPARWRQIIRSHRAKFRAGIARTPAERAAVDWQMVIDDATNGITSNFTVMLSPSDGWGNAFMSQAQVSSGWHQMTPFIIGMADTTDAYATWLATDLMSRAPFLIRTPDKRFPAGETRAEQQAITGTNRDTPAGSRIYMRNRPPGEDTPSFPWGTSYYDHIRYYPIRKASGAGPFDLMTVAENDMLAAEGYLRTGQVALAAALIDKTRVPNGLPSVAGITDLNTPVPGGNACVPRVPSAAAPATLSCGNIFEAMKWEKRMETAMNSFAQWWIDSRGWGDLVADTPVEYPVPYQELDSRKVPIYNTVKQASGPNTYGF